MSPAHFGLMQDPIRQVRFQSHPYVCDLRQRLKLVEKRIAIAALSQASSDEACQVTVNEVSTELPSPELAATRSDITSLDLSTDYPFPLTTKQIYQANVEARKFATDAFCPTHAKPQAVIEACFPNRHISPECLLKYAAEHKFSTTEVDVTELNFNDSILDATINEVLTFTDFPKDDMKLLKTSNSSIKNNQNSAQKSAFRVVKHSSNQHHDRATAQGQHVEQRPPTPLPFYKDSSHYRKTQPPAKPAVTPRPSVHRHSRHQIFELLYDTPLSEKKIEEKTKDYNVLTADFAKVKRQQTNKSKSQQIIADTRSGRSELYLSKSHHIMLNAKIMSSKKGERLLKGMVNRRIASIASKNISKSINSPCYISMKTGGSSETLENSCVKTLKTEVGSSGAFQIAASLGDMCNSDVLKPSGNRKKLNQVETGSQKSKLYSTGYKYGKVIKSQHRDPPNWKEELAGVLKPVDSPFNWGRVVMSFFVAGELVYRCIKDNRADHAKEVVEGFYDSFISIGRIFTLHGGWAGCLQFYEEQPSPWKESKYPLNFRWQLDRIFQRNQSFRSSAVKSENGKTAVKHKNNQTIAHCECTVSEDRKPRTREDYIGSITMGTYDTDSNDGSEFMGRPIDSPCVIS